MGWKPVVSATPEDFAAHVDVVASFGTVVAMSDVVAHIEGERPLPRRPVLITFDDGYRDNFEIAHEVLAGRGLPAALFLATEWVDAGVPFFWDVAGEMFRRSERTSVAVPLLGPVEWRESDERLRVAHEWIERAKRLAPEDLSAVLELLGEALEVDDPSRDLDSMRLRWSDAKTMRDSGWEFGAHTARHTILSNVDLATARREVIESRDRIESELGTSVTAFAYPNGGAGDFSAEHVGMLADEGFSAAFTLMAGPVSLREATGSPLTIGRIFVGHGDTLGRFRVKATAPPWVMASRRTISRLRSRLGRA